MKTTFEKIITGIILILSVYIISLDLFFFIGHFFVPVLEENLFVGIKLFIYALVALNLLSVTFLFLVVAKDKFHIYKKSILVSLTLLLLITVSHLLMLNFQDISNSYEILYKFQPHSIKTLILLSIFGFFLAYKYSKLSSDK